MWLARSDGVLVNFTSTTEGLLVKAARPLA